MYMQASSRNSTSSRHRQRDSARVRILRSYIRRRRLEALLKLAAAEMARAKTAEVPQQ